MVDANGCNGEDGDGEDESDDDTTTVGAVALIVCVEEGGTLEDVGGHLLDLHQAGYVSLLVAVGHDDTIK